MSSIHPSAFGAKVIRSLELPKLMHEVGHLEMAKIRAIVSYWRHIGDTPGNVATRYRKLFGEAPPLIIRSITPSSPRP